MKNQLELDEWDLAVIYYLKQSQNRTIEDVKNIWRERCDLPEGYTVSAQDLVNHFLPIVLKIGEENRSLNYSALSIVEGASPENVWKCHDVNHPRINSRACESLTPTFSRLTTACPSSAGHKAQHETGSLERKTILFAAFKSESKTTPSEQ